MAFFGDLGTIDLESLNALGQLQNRFDAKYLVPVEALTGLVERNKSGFLVLDHDGRRSTPYATRYFDTDDLRTFRDHVQGRRRRFKVRTRHYGNPSEGFLELKMKLSRDMTKKVRWPRDTDSIGSGLNDFDHRLIGEVLNDQYGFGLPATLDVALTSDFSRTTLFATASRDRITIDTELVVSHGGRKVAFDPGVAVVEVKSISSRSPVQRMLLDIGLRPTSMSKYCVGVAVTREGVHSNRWRPQLRRLAG